MNTPRLTSGRVDLHDTVAPPPPAPPARSIAVALAEQADPARAPRVVASGKGAVADAILALAFASGVKVRQDADLAQALAALELDSEIPPEAYYAVAEILVYLHRANGNGGDWHGPVFAHPPVVTGSSAATPRGTVGPGAFAPIIAADPGDADDVHSPP